MTPRKAKSVKKRDFVYMPDVIWLHPLDDACSYDSPWDKDCVKYVREKLPAKKRRKK